VSGASDSHESRSQANVDIEGVVENLEITEVKAEINSGLTETNSFIEEVVKVVSV